MRLRQFEPAFRIYRSLKGNWYLQNFAKEAGLAGAYAYAVKAYRLDLQRERNPKKRNDLRFLLAQSCFQLARHQARSGKAADAREQAGCAKEELTALSVQKNDKRNRWRALVLLGDMQNQFYNSERQAIALYRTVQQEAPTGKIRARASLKIAAIELKQNRLNAAEKDFAAVRFSTERAFAVYEQANLEYYRGNFSPAIRRLQKLQTQLQPQDTLTNNVLERLTFIEMYRKDSLALARFARAELFERQSKWEAAAEAFGKLAQTDIALALPALERAARIYLKHKRTPEAFVLLNGFLQRHPQNPGNDRVLLLLGRTYEKMNQPEQALNTYLTLIRSYPDSFYLEEARQQARTLKQSTGQPFQGD
jgi:outer membrane protein assembly factor BamD (BamD/ComL family)